MGNTLGSQRVEDLRSYLLDSPDIVVHSLLATYKLFKLFIPNENEEDDHADLRMESILKPYRDATFLVQCRFSGMVHPNVVPYESSEILNKSAILMRQFFGRNLFDRLYSNPHLTSAHYQWITVQILMAVAQLHSVGIIHGDIKSENIFLVGSFHAILTDMSTFIKPVFLPLNDPVAAASMFFESGVKRRRCFVAPERFNDKLTSRVLDEHGRRMTFFDKEFTTDFMRVDLFSAGLTIAEMFLEGQHVIDLPELLAYRAGSFSLDSSVYAKIPNACIRSLVEQLTRVSPHDRPENAVVCLEKLFQEWPVFPGLLVPLMTLASHPVYANADMRMMLVRRNWDYIAQVLGVEDAAPGVTAYDAFTELDVFEQCVSSSLVSRGVTSSVQPLIEWSTTPAEIFPHPRFSHAGCLGFSHALLDLWRSGMAAHVTHQGEVWRDTMSAKTNDLYNIFFSDKKEEQVSGRRPPLVSSSAQTTAAPLLASFLGTTVTACNCARSKLVYLDLVLHVVVSSEKNSSSWISDYVIPYVHDLAGSASEVQVRLRAMDCLGGIVSVLEEAETGLFSEYLFPLCLGGQEGGVKLAVQLVRAATRLAQGEAKKLEAIRMFAEKVIEHGQREELVENLEIVQLANGRRRPQERAVKLWYDFAQAGGEKFWRHVVDKFCQVLDAPAVETHIVPVLVNQLGGQIENNAEALLALASVVNTVKSLTPGTMVKISQAAVPALSSSSDLFTRAAARELLQAIGAQMAPVDQFVFLRHLFPEDCHNLIDLIAHAKNENPQIGSEFSPPVVRRPATPHCHTVSIPLTNPTCPSPVPPAIVRQTEPVSLSLAGFRDWRVEAVGFPSRPSPDLGCLSVDGTLISLYGSSFPESDSLLRQHLNVLPGVPIIASSKKPKWKPESLLLATLSDFTSGGIAVPVAAVDATDDGRIIVAGGSDASVRIWRLSSLETESVMQSARSFRIPNASRLFTLKTVRNTKSVALANDNQFLIYRVDAAVGGGSMTKGGTLLPVATPTVQSPEHPFGHTLAMETFDTDLSSCVVGACEQGAVLNWDVRMNKFAWNVKMDPNLYLAPPCGLVVGKDATVMAVASMTGLVTVFDTRFLRNPIAIWAAPAGISTIAPSSCPNHIWVSSGSEMALLDFQTGGTAKSVLSTALEMRKVNQSFNLTKWTPGQPHPEWNISKILKSSESNARCLLECSDQGGASWTLLSGHNDGIARYWNGNNEGGIVCPKPMGSPVSPVVISGSCVLQPGENAEKSPMVSSDLIAGHPCTVTEGHRDVINDMCLAYLQYDVVVTASRDGLLKLWK